MKSSFAQPATFSRIVFFRLSAEQKNLLAASRLLAGQTEFALVEEETALAAVLTADSLLVSGEPVVGRLAALLFKQGVAHSLSWHDFSLNFQAVLAGWQRAQGQVILAFLPLQLQNFLSGFFKMSGFEVLVSPDFAALAELLKNPASYLVLDIDGTSQKSRPGREQVFRFLLRHKKENPLMAISMIKDFDCGNLYDDIRSSLRELNSLLLSPDEYILFISRYLHQFRLEKLEENFRAYAGWENCRPLPVRRRNFSMPLREARLLYQETLGRSEQRKREDKILQAYNRELQSILLQNRMLEWLEEALGHQEKTRASFSFISSSAETLADLPKKLQLPLQIKPAAGEETAPESLHE